MLVYLNHDPCSLLLFRHSWFRAGIAADLWGICSFKLFSMIQFQKVMLRVMKFLALLLARHVGAIHVRFWRSDRSILVCAFLFFCTITCAQTAVHVNACSFVHHSLPCSSSLLVPRRHCWGPLENLLFTANLRNPISKGWCFTMQWLICFGTDFGIHFSIGLEGMLVSVIQCLGVRFGVCFGRQVSALHLSSLIQPLRGGWSFGFGIWLNLAFGRVFLLLSWHLIWEACWRSPCYAWVVSFTFQDTGESSDLVLVLGGKLTLSMLAASSTIWECAFFLEVWSPFQLQSQRLV